MQTFKWNFVMEVVSKLKKRIESATKRLIHARRLAKFREVTIELYVARDATVAKIKTFSENYQLEEFILMECCVLRYTSIRKKVGIRFLVKSEEIGLRFITDLKSEFPNLEDNLRANLK